MKKFLVFLTIFLASCLVLFAVTTQTRKNRTIPTVQPPETTQTVTEETTKSSEVVTTQDQPKKKSSGISLLASLIKEKVSTFSDNKSDTITYPIVDTGVTTLYNNTQVLSQISTNEPFFGQDAHYQGNAPTYVDNKDGTVTDTVTGLMWQKDMGQKKTFSEAQAEAENSNLAGYDDWRIPSIKELYSLIQYTGQSGGETANKLFIDEAYFVQPLEDTSKGEREIDAQTWSSTVYKGLTMNNDVTRFGVNFIDGRIKGYPVSDRRTNTERKMYFRLVRGNPEYGKNTFVDNNDGTITDTATGLMWQKADSGTGINWESALQYAQSLTLAGHDDWRLPNAKELQSIVDYTRSLQETNSAAIDPIFSITSITDERGKTNYPFFWSSTTHLDGKDPESGAVYVSFGEALGKMNGQILDVHGAGAQRSDPKDGLTSDYPKYFGPQGDVQRVFNFVRAVRDAK